MASSWKLLTDRKLCPFGVIIGIALLIAGIYCLCINSADSQECETSIIYQYENITSLEYSNCSSAYHSVVKFCKDLKPESCFCGLNLTVKEAIEGDVVIGYTLETFNETVAQGDTFYESKDDSQLAGSLSTNVSSKCKPFDYNDGLPIVPCGALANAMFTDEIGLYDKNNDHVPAKAELLRDDDKKTFRNPNSTNLAVAFQNFSKPINWTKNIWELDKTRPRRLQNNGLQNEAFIVWMRPDLPIRPIWRLDRSADPYKAGLPEGSYTVEVFYNYPYSVYNGPRTLTVYREIPKEDKICPPTVTRRVHQTARYIVCIASVVIGCLLLGGTAASIILYKVKESRSSEDLPASHCDDGTCMIFLWTEEEVIKRLLDVFSGLDGTAQDRISAYANRRIAPFGWQAVWELSKESCQTFGVIFPWKWRITVAAVDFVSLSARVKVASNIYDSILKTVRNVPLIELWPLEQNGLDADSTAKTAECIHLMRFFYNNIWMPWDDDENEDGSIFNDEKIKERVKLYFELQDGSIPDEMARSITSIRERAINVHNRFKQMESSKRQDSGDKNDKDSLLPTTKLRLEMELQRICDSWKCYENALTRRDLIVELKANPNKRKLTVLRQDPTALDIRNIFKQLRLQRAPEHYSPTVTASLQEALAQEPAELVVYSGVYDVPEVRLSQVVISCFKGATLKSSKARQWLIYLLDNCCLKGLTLHCANVDAGVVADIGTQHVDGCTLLCKGKRSAQIRAVEAMAGSTLLIDNTVVDNFHTGLIVRRGAKVELRNCTIKNCEVGIRVYAGGQVILSGTTIERCTEYIRIDDTIKLKGLYVGLNCTIGSGDLLNEIVTIPN